MTRQIDTITQDLYRAGNRVELLEEQLARERQKRNKLVAEATALGLSTRQIGKIINVSSPAVCHILRRMGL